MICLHCYNRIVTRSSAEFQQHALEQQPHAKVEMSKDIEVEISKDIKDNILTDVLFFSQAIGIITDILYEREYKALPPIWDFEELQMLMESEDKWLKNFF